MDTISEEMIIQYKEFVTETTRYRVFWNQYFVQPEELQEQLPTRKLKLSITQINIIGALYEQSEPMTLSEIAKLNAMNNSTLTQPIRSLAKMGILRRFQKEDNQRNIYVELTPFGKEIRETQAKIVDNYLLRKIYDILTLEELVHAKEYLKAYNDIIQRYNPK